MPTSQARALLWAGRFFYVIAALSCIAWIGTVHDAYVIEHQWPAAPATVYSALENSQEVQPPSTRQHHYWVYWMEFLVALDLPPNQCPGNILVLANQEPKCTGTIDTPKSRSRLDAVDWVRRHPLNSRVIVHYDPQSHRMGLGGESILYTYPWRKIAITIMILAAAMLMVLFGRSGLSFGKEDQMSAMPQL
jgi:hypothetical protein